MIDASDWYQATALALLRGDSLAGFHRRKRRRFARAGAANASLRIPGGGYGGGAGAPAFAPGYSGPIDSDPSAEGAPVDSGSRGGSPFIVPVGDKLQLNEYGAGQSISEPGSLFPTTLPPSIASSSIASMALDGYRKHRCACQRCRRR